MTNRHFPVRPNLDQLRDQAKDMLKAIRRGDPNAIAEFRAFHSKPIDAASARLSDAQFVLARSYGLPSWPRLVTACRMTDAVWRGDVETVRTLVLRHPRLLDEDARGVKGNWGPPMSYAANLGQDAIIEMLRGLGASDLQYAFGRACLQGQTNTARKLHAMMGSQRPPDDALGGPAYTLNVSGTALLLELGARVYDDHRRRLAPVDTVLETDSRNPLAKHRILELYAENGSSWRIRRQWLCTAVVSICSRSICAAIRSCSREGSLMKKSILPSLVVTMKCWRRMERLLAVGRYYICAQTTMRLLPGYLIEG